MPGLVQLAARAFACSAILVGAASAIAAAAPSHRRLPSGFRWGRCLLVVEGQTRISGRCAYRLYKGGDFHIAGPRQVYDGIDYPKSWLMSGRRSADYWADVFRDEDGWTGYGNRNISAVHGDGVFGILHRRGACYLNRTVRVCLWAR